MRVLMLARDSNASNPKFAHPFRKVRLRTSYTDLCASRVIRCKALVALGMREFTHGWNLEMQMRVARER